jgi:adenylate cyclase
MNVRDAAAQVVGWMLSEGRYNTHMREFGDEMCRRIVAAGIPIWRAMCVVNTLHPQIMGTAYRWRRDVPSVVRLEAEHGLENTPAFTASPFTEVQKTGVAVRRRLDAPAAPLDFAILEEFRREGATDYVALPMRFSDGHINAVSFTTDRASGFTEDEVAGLAEIAHALGIIVELQSSRRIAKSLMDTYIGRRTGARVLRGAIKRGHGETIHAVIWLCDLRGFTASAERLAASELTAMLNEYFEVMAGAVTAHGGEVLKFMGDGMLAIFELHENQEAGERCAAALKAARAAAAGIAQRNAARSQAASPPIRFGLALHLSEVYYGNIGAPDRLDFTVIGPAVNHAARLEKLASELGRIVVTSASFAAATSEPLEPLGPHRLRGVSEPQEVYAPAGLESFD